MRPLPQHVLAPAKVNLFLRIVGRRADGYHLLDSLMVPISLHDHLYVRCAPCPTAPLPQITVRVDTHDVPAGPDNLAHRAAALFLAETRTSLKVDIRIRKRIPVGSGLGGGSSDAAATLLALNRTLGLPYQCKELAEMGARLGADVPFFVYGRPGRVRGIGEQITVLDLPTPLSLVVCSDGCVLPTKQVYAMVEPSLTRRKPAISIDALVSGRGPLSRVLVNDLETAAVKIHPEVLSLKARLMEQGAQGALMTGSGSAVFGVWPNDQQARTAARRLRRHGLWAAAVRTLAVSPAL